jgi:hypothetical protein
MLRAANRRQDASGGGDDAMSKFIGEAVEVEMSAPPGGVLAPSSFTWRGQTLQVEALLEMFPEAGWPRTLRTRGWWHKRFRNHYVVRVSDGHVYQLTLDRSGGRREWVLLKEIE